MEAFKSVVTLTWDFETDLKYEDALQFARDQLKQLVAGTPSGVDFENFSVHLALSKMRRRQRLKHLGNFSPEDVFPHISTEPSKRDYTVGDKVYSVRMNSDRYFVFRDNPSCVVCGIAGTKMILDMNPADSSPHFNLYAVQNGRLILMTKDHIVPKALGGKDELSNYQAACSICNNLKACFNLTIEQCRELRQLYDNVDRLPKKEVRKLINRRREELAVQNSSKENPHGEHRSLGHDSTESTVDSSTADSSNGNGRDSNGSGINIGTSGATSDDYATGCPNREEAG